MPRQFPAEVRREAYERMLAGEAIKDLVEELGITMETLYRWQREAQVVRSRPTSVESTGGHVIMLRGVPKADGEKVKGLTDTAVNKARSGFVAPLVTQAADDPAEQLKKLVDLHQSGLLTDEEFAVKRETIIAKL